MLLPLLIFPLLVQSFVLFMFLQMFLFLTVSAAVYVTVSASVLFVCFWFCCFSINFFLFIYILLSVIYDIHRISILFFVILFNIGGYMCELTCMGFSVIFLVFSGMVLVMFLDPPKARLFCLFVFRSCAISSVFFWTCACG